MPTPLIQNGKMPCVHSCPKQCVLVAAPSPGGEASGSCSQSPQCQDRPQPPWAQLCPLHSASGGHSTPECFSVAGIGFLHCCSKDAPLPDGQDSAEHRNNLSGLVASCRQHGQRISPLLRQPGPSSEHRMDKQGHERTSQGPH